MEQGQEYTYRDFYRDSLHKPRKTEKAEMKEIETHLQELTQQHDFGSIEIIRRLSALFAGENREAGYRVSFLINDFLRMGEREQKILSAIANGLKNNQSTIGQVNQSN